MTPKSMKIAGMIAVGIGIAAYAAGTLGANYAADSIQCVADWEETARNMTTTLTNQDLCGVADMRGAVQQEETADIAKMFGIHITIGGFLAFLAAWTVQNVKKSNA